MILGRRRALEPNLRAQTRNRDRRAAAAPLTPAALPKCGCARRIASSASPGASGFQALHEATTPESRASRAFGVDHWPP
jgi:hypothetical protein